MMCWVCHQYSCHNLRKLNLNKMGWILTPKAECCSNRWKFKNFNLIMDWKGVEFRMRIMRLLIETNILSARRMSKLQRMFWRNTVLITIRTRVTCWKGSNSRQGKWNKKKTQPGELKAMPNWSQCKIITITNQTNV